MSTPSFQAPDFWRVNSYGYPNPFSQESKAQEAWETFESFYNAHESSYSDLKNYWASARAPRRLDSHAVESWKATFEEFGLLYVISRSDRITITPAGFQFYEAAQQKDEGSFIWIGINLLFRYPLRGPPRGRRRNVYHTGSDLLPYRFLYSVMRDLADYFWWTELERVLCRVFATAEARAAIDAVNEIRATPSRLTAYPLVVANRKGAFYNSLNQVANHAGMNHLVLDQDDASEHYPAPESRRRHSIVRSHLPLVNAALGDLSAPAGCRTSALYIDRLPTAPRHTDEQDYFEYLGAEVVPLTSLTASAPTTLTLAGDKVTILRPGEHFTPSTSTADQLVIKGRTSGLCFLARSHRVILASDLAWTYMVTGKDVVGPDSINITLRRARPITDAGPIQHLIGEEDA